jgi:epoxyqueuosine reductase
MGNPEDKDLSDLIREKAFDLGFDLCGIAHSRPLQEHKSKIAAWCSAGLHSDMQYLCNDPAKRINPELLFPGTKSVIVTGLNYYSEIKQGGRGVPVISRYAYGINYHDVIKARLNNLLEFIKLNRPGVEGRTFVDSAPILEKAWAHEAGLGWPGKHSVLINETIGSFFFIGIILVNAELKYDKPFAEDKCGSCRMCIESCPTGAINENRTIDTKRCIAYLTIESKSPVPDEFASKMEGRIFGCDRCQEVCPWNKAAKPNSVPDFAIQDELVQMTPEDWQKLSKENFKRLFRKSAIGRKKYETLIENISIVTGSAT